MTVYGDGEERDALRRLAESEGIADRIRWMGQAARSALARGYADADAFVLASRRETFGVVYVEAMAAGLPVIATACGGPEDFVTPENGLLIPADDEAALQSAMERMILHGREFDRERISRQTREAFSPAEIARKLTKVYEELVKC